jgi:hypothetical protein
MERTSITRIWMGMAEESIRRVAGDGAHVEAPAVQDALDHAIEWALRYLREQGLAVDPGYDGSLRTLDFKTETDCLEAHERLQATDDRGRPFKLRFVLRPFGVTIMVIT